MEELKFAGGWNKNLACIYYFVNHLQSSPKVGLGYKTSIALLFIYLFFTIDNKT